MSKATLKSHNDSLQQASTALPLTISKDRSSLDGLSSALGSRTLGRSLQIGGGSYGSYMRDHLQRLRNDIENTTGALEREQRRLHKVEKDLAAAESEYSQKRQRYRLFASAADDVMLHKMDEVRTLERHLERAIAELNKGAADNENLREQIDQLRKERKVLNNVFKKLERGMGKTNKEVNDLVAQISEHRARAADAQQKGKALTKMLERERSGFREFTEQIKAGLNHEAEVGREQERGQKANVQASGGNKRRAYMIADEEEAFSETDMFRRIFRLSFLNTIQRRHIRQHQKNIEVFEQAFATIKSSTGISDIEEIVKIFIALEQRNFSLLTYVNQLNRDIESIEIRNKELQAKLADHKCSEAQTATRREQALSDLSQQLQQTRAATKEKIAALAESDEMLKEVKPLLNSIVAFLKKEMPSLIRAGYEDMAPPLKSSPPSAQDENLHNHLTYIEEMLMLFRTALAKDRRPEVLPLSKAQAVERPRLQDLPVAHITGDDTDDEVEGGISERMYTRPELRERAAAALAKRRKKPGQGRHAEGRTEDDCGTEVVAAGALTGRRDGGGGPSSGTPKEATETGAGPRSPSMKEPEEDEGGSRWWRNSKETRPGAKR